MGVSVERISVVIVVIGHKTKFSTQKKFVCPRGTKTGDRRQRRVEKRGKGEEKRYLPRGTKNCLWIERGQSGPQANGSL